ncbi:chaplin [Streptomyces sp. NPDC018610]|uniref:chaplin n=1 Tax=Streptomyces sp. NPDC018610 TaxID=3365049 RepID=UPI00379A7618
MSRIAKAATIALGTGAVVLGGAGLAAANSGAEAVAANSPGVASGNVVQVPVHAPINVCGNTVNVVGALNPAIGNFCSNK